MATLKADFVQGIIMMFGVSALLAMIIICPQVGGLQNGVNNMVSYMQQNQMAPMNSQMVLSLVATILMTSFGTWGLPRWYIKYYGIRDDKEVKRA